MLKPKHAYHLRWLLLILSIEAVGVGLLYRRELLTVFRTLSERLGQELMSAIIGLVGVGVGVLWTNSHNRRHERQKAREELIVEIDRCKNHYQAYLKKLHRARVQQDAPALFELELFGYEMNARFNGSTLRVFVLFSNSGARIAATRFAKAMAHIQEDLEKNEYDEVRFRLYNSWMNTVGTELQETLMELTGIKQDFGGHPMYIGFKKGRTYRDLEKYRTDMPAPWQPCARVDPTVRSLDKDAEKISAKVLPVLGSLRCDAHGNAAQVVILKNLTVEVQGCCEDFANKVVAELKKSKILVRR